MAAHESGGDPVRLGRFLAGLAAYQSAPRAAARPAGRAVARIGTVRLLACGGPEDGPAVLLVPSIINGGALLDLLPGRSLVEGLAARGLAVFRIDWGALDRGERRLGLAGLVSARLVPLAARMPGRFLLAGHCLGGTLAAAAAAVLEPRLSRLVLIATPWRFSAYGPEAASAWTALAPIARALGALPLEALNPLFWARDMPGVFSKYAGLAACPPDPAGLELFAAVEDWANGGPALPLPAARDIFVGLMREDRAARGRWRVRGRPVRPERLSVPAVEIGAAGDRLVPADARPDWPGLAHVTLEGGHVGIIVGSRRGRLLDALASAACTR